MANTYTYSPLDVQNKEIRLLLVTPDEGDGSIDCVVLHTPLQDELQYKALSYTWGTSARTMVINVDGCAFLVTRNLFSALAKIRARRCPGEGFCIWVDAICINQDDVMERNAHVQYMHEVYQNSEEVIVWLGPANNDSDLAIHLLWEEALRFAREEPKIGDALPPQREEPRHILQPTAASLMASQPRCRRAIAKLFQRAWFQRVWVLQEVVFGAEVHVLCGDDTIPWLPMAMAAQQLLKPLQQSGAHILAPDFEMAAGTINVLSLCMSPAVSEWTPERSISEWSSLESALFHTRALNATDPRDKIFSVLNMIPRSEWPLEPDYSISPPDVFIAVVKSLIAKRGHLGVLNLCERPSGYGKSDHLRSSLKHLPSLPTWVPDWTRMRVTGALQDCCKRFSAKPFDASSGMAPIWAIETGRNRLHIKGLTLGKVVSVCRTTIGSVREVSKAGLWNNLRKWFLCQRESRGLLNDPSQLDAFHRTLICNSLPMTQAGQQELQGFADWYETADPAITPTPELFDALFCATSFRSIYVTEKGHIGLGPLDTTPGDSVCILFGGQTPFILGKRAGVHIPEPCQLHSDIVDCQHWGCWNDMAVVITTDDTILIGETYLHGSMYGEALERLTDLENEAQTFLLS